MKRPNNTRSAIAPKAVTPRVIEENDFKRLQELGDKRTRLLVHLAEVQMGHRTLSARLAETLAADAEGRKTLAEIEAELASIEACMPPL
jgi:hypothetical protein